MSKYLRVDEVVESVSKTHSFNKDTLKFLNTSDVYEGKIVSINELPVTELKGQAKKTIRQHDILFSEIRPKNKRYAYVDLEDTEDFVVSTKLMVLRKFNPEVDNRYFYYFLTNDQMLSALQARAENRICSFPQITFDLLSGYKLRVPGLSEQQKIAAVLLALDTKIDSNNRINAELEALAKTLYEYWFVQFDFPDENGKPYKSSGGKMEYNATLKREIPTGWEPGTASSLFDFNPSTPLTMNKEANYIDMNSLPLSGFMTNAPERKEFSGGAKFRNGDVVVARITPCLENGKTALITLFRDDEVGFGSTEFIVIRGKHYPLSAFAAQLGRSSSFRQFAISNMTGTSGRKRIDANTLETFSLPLPTEDLLLRYEVAVGPFLKRMTNNAKENEHLIQLRDWLLPMLMNGQVTVA
jgi:type I restriction enzyme, S subunit